MKLLVTGSRGQLATDLIRSALAAGDEVIGLSRAELDITDQDAVRAAITTNQPDVVVNCAAWTAVDACEDDPNKADRINGTAVESLGQVAQAVGAHLVQISTDYVFDGTKSTPYLEDDPTNPRSAYGRSKLLGETAALAADASVIRTSWVCSAHGGNMVATILRLAKEHPTLRFVSDQRGHPTFTSDLATAIRSLSADRVPGILHVTNAGAVSWFEFAQEVLRTTGQDPDRIEPIRTSELLPSRPAARPANSVLSNQAFADLGYKPLRNFRKALAEVVQAYV